MHYHPIDEVSSLFLQHEPVGSTDLTLSPALKQLEVLETLPSTMKEPRKPAAFPVPSRPGAPSTASPTRHSTYLAPRLPLMMGAVTTLLPFMGWLMTDSGTVIRVGSLPYREKEIRFMRRRRQGPPHSVTQGPQEPRGPLQGPMLL